MSVNPATIGSLPPGPSRAAGLTLAWRYATFRGSKGFPTFPVAILAFLVFVEIGRAHV